MTANTFKHLLVCFVVACVLTAFYYPLYTYFTHQDWDRASELRGGVARWRSAFDHGWDAARLNVSFERLRELEIRNDVMIVLEATNPWWLDWRSVETRLIAAGAAFARLQNQSFDHADEVRADLETRIVKSLVEPLLSAVERDVAPGFGNSWWQVNDDGFDDYYLDFLRQRRDVLGPSVDMHNVTMESLKATHEWANEALERSAEWLREVKKVHAKRMKKYGV